LLKYCLRAKAKASKKRLNFCEVRAVHLSGEGLRQSPLIGAFSLRKSQLSPIVSYAGPCSAWLIEFF
jgi:hypothetical protein